MTFAVGNYDYDEIVADIKRGTFDGVLSELLMVATARKAEIDKWQPLNDLMEMLRTIETTALGSAEQKARTGAEMNMTLKPYLEDADPAVRGLASGVRARMMTDLLGMSFESVAKWREKHDPVAPVPQA